LTMFPISREMKCAMGAVTPAQENAKRRSRKCSTHHQK
jgi:hypothetical protein